MTTPADLVRAIAVAWKSCCAYPPEHPSVQAAVATALRQLTAQLLASHHFKLGVSREGLLLAEDTLSFPLARELAEALYLQDVALLVFEEGLVGPDLASFLRLLAPTGEARRGAHESLADALAAAGVRHVRVQAIDLSSVRATDDLVEPRHEAVSLWDEIVRSVLVDKPLSDEGLRLLGLGQAKTPRAVGWLLADCASQLAARGDAGRAAALGSALAKAVTGQFQRSRGAALRHEVAQQVAELAQSLPAALREVLLEAALRVLAEDEESAEATALVARRFDPDMVLRAFQRLRVAGVRLSRHALQLLETLSRSAHPEPRAGSADLRLVRELALLFRDEDVDRHMPADHQALLKNAAALEVPSVALAAAPSDAEGRERLAAFAAGPHQALALALVDTLRNNGRRDGFEVLLRRLETLYRSMLTAHAAADAVAVAESLRELREKPPSSEVEARVAETMARLTTGDLVPPLLEALQKAGPEASALVRRLGEALGAVVIRNLLLALAAEADRSRRHRLLDVLTSLGEGIVGHATLLLADKRWFVQRNMIALLRAVGDRSSLPQVRRLAKSADLRVRLEAIKSLFQLDSDVPRALLDDAIASPDPKVAEAAVVLTGSYGIAEGVTPLLALLESRSCSRALRVKVLRALGELGDPQALPKIEPFLKESWLGGLGGLGGPGAEERRAAYESLAGYAPEARAAQVQRGLQSRDAEVRAVCARLTREEPQAPHEGASGA